MRDVVLVLNFDAEASRAVTRKLRAERVFCRIVPGSISAEEILRQEPLGLLLAGGTEGGAEKMDEGALQLGLPVLALGGAARTLAGKIGGSVGETAFCGAVAGLCYDAECPLFQGLEGGERMLSCVRHLSLPENAQAICRAGDAAVGFACQDAPVFGLQLEAEPNDPEAARILRNFALNICGCTPWWDDDAFVARATEEIGRTVGEGRAVCVMTGGLDTGVSALLAFKALGSRLQGVFVDTGLLRENESEDFLGFYRDALGMNVTFVDAKERFLSALLGVRDPEEKKRRVADVMDQVLSEQWKNMGPFDAQISGLCCNDLLYGGAQPCRAGNLPVIEPVRELFKDEIRRVGDFLGLPSELLSRQPFPDAGLALRILGEVTEERLETLRPADAIFRAEIVKAGLNRRLWQYFAVYSPMPGEDAGCVICLRAVQTGGGPAHAARLPYDLAEEAVERILRECGEVRRVVYDLTPSAHYAGIEWQ